MIVDVPKNKEIYIKTTKDRLQPITKMYQNN